MKFWGPGAGGFRDRNKAKWSPQKQKNNNIFDISDQIYEQNTLFGAKWPILLAFTGKKHIVGCQVGRDLWKVQLEPIFVFIGPAGHKEQD